MKFLLSFLFIFVSNMAVMTPASADSGLPQLDTSTYSQQIFWLFICFTIIYLCMHYIFVPKFRKIHGLRNTKILTNIEKATKLKNEIDDILKKIDKNNEDLKSYKENMIAEQKKKASNLKDKKLEELEVYKKEQIHLFKERYKTYEKGLLTNKEKNTIEITSLILDKLSINYKENELVSIFNKKEEGQL